MLPDDELHRLADDIRENGLQNPIIVDDSGRILDGRNRAAACKLAGVEPSVEPFEGAEDEAAAFVLSQNVSRRHMTTGQQAMSTALVLADTGKRENGRWARNAVPSDTSGSGSRQWAQRMAEAGAILDHAPDIAEQVVNGGMALDAAYKEVERRRDVERRNLEEQERMEAEEADRLAHLLEAAPDYAARIGTDFPTARQAYAAWEDDHKREAAQRRREQMEREQQEREARKGRISLFTSIAKSIATCSGYGNYANLDKLRAEYRPDELDRNITSEFSNGQLDKGIRFLTLLKEWNES